jgi:CheY-like chemotaxis protein/HPt (histidine-containing phosphotransfer) domain-containing protein
VAEDNPVNQEVCRQMLESIGCTVRVVNNGVQALGVLSETAFDLVLMDCQMPEMDGYEATRAIRGNEAVGGGSPGRQIIVALTAHAMEGDREQCLAAGMDDYMSKPFSLKQLQELLSRWLPCRGNDLEEHRNGADLAPSPPRDSVNARDCPTGDRLEGGSTDSTRSETFHIDRKIWEGIAAIESSSAPGLLNRILNVYLEDSSEAMLRLKEAAFRRNLDEVSALVHSLKSSSANVGAVNLSSLCAEMERKVIAGGSGELEALVGRIEAEYLSVRDVLRAELVQESPSNGAGAP